MPILDFFVVLNTDRTIRKSWVVWEEDGKYPDFILEILSDSTAKTDRTVKKNIYQNIFHTSNYFWFDPYTLEFQGFHLVDNKYQPLGANDKGHLWSEPLGLYLGIHERTLRFFTPEGELVLTPEAGEKQQARRADQEARRANQEARRANQEAQRADQETQLAQQETQRADQEAQRADQEARRADQEAQRAERLVAKLRELNIDPNTI